MEILSYLAELIKIRREIGITGLGTISKKKSPGRYDAETHSFLPPSYVLEFTEEVKETSTLAEFVSKKKNISVGSSAYYIEQFADDLQERLKETGEASLGELGKLSVSDKGISFTPSAESNFGFDFYGLPSLKDDMAVKEAISERATNEMHKDDLRDMQAEPDDQPVYEEISEVSIQESPKPPVFIETPEDMEEDPGNLEETPKNGGEQNPDPNIFHAYRMRSDQPTEVQPVNNDVTDIQPVDFVPANVQNEIEDNNQKMPAYVKVLIAFIILMAGAIAVYFVKPELFNGTEIKEQAKTPVVNPDRQRADSAARADSTMRAAQVITAASDSLKDTSAVAEKPISQTDSLNTWEVIGASVINQKEANKFIAQMKNIGITAKVIPTVPGKRRIKISVGTFYDEVSARAGRKELVIKLKNPELYIHQNKHTHKPE